MRSFEEIPHKLREADRNLPFRVPGHYFDDFPARLQSRLDQETSPGAGKRLRMIDYLKPALGLAAAFASVFLLVYFPARLVTHSVTMAQRSGTSDEDKIINLVEQVDDHTFFTLLENGTTEEKIDGPDIESYIAANYSDLDIFLEIQK